MWAQQWNNILDIALPYPHAQTVDVTPEMIKQVKKHVPSYQGRLVFIYTCVRISVVLLISSRSFAQWCSWPLGFNKRLSDDVKGQILTYQEAVQRGLFYIRDRSTKQPLGIVFLIWTQSKFVAIQCWQRRRKCRYWFSALWKVTFVIADSPDFHNSSVLLTKRSVFTTAKNMQISSELHSSEDV